MTRVMLYFVKCGEITGNPDTVVKASTNYAEVTDFRDGLERVYAAGEKVCSGLHPIQHKEVTL